MNNHRRKELRAVADDLDLVRERLQALLEAETDAFDALPDSLAGSERGEAMEAAAEDIDEAQDTLDEIAERLRGI